MRSGSTYDSKCYELAKVFMSDFEFRTDEAELETTAKLAQAIQDAIEEFIDDNCQF